MNDVRSENVSAVAEVAAVTQRWLDEIHAEPLAVQAVARALARIWIKTWAGGRNSTPQEFVGQTAAHLFPARNLVTALMAAPAEDRRIIARALQSAQSAPVSGGNETEGEG